MIDSIGLGEIIANLIYYAILVIALTGSIIFLSIKKKFLALIWLSIFLNLLSFLYLLGTRDLFIFLLNYILWPIINIFLIVYYTKIKLKK